MKLLSFDVAAGIFREIDDVSKTSVAIFATSIQRKTIELIQYMLKYLISNVVLVIFDENEDDYVKLRKIMTNAILIIAAPDHCQLPNIHDIDYIYPGSDDTFHIVMSADRINSFISSLFDGRLFKVINSISSFSFSFALLFDGGLINFSKQLRIKQVSDEAQLAKYALWKAKNDALNEEKAKAALLIRMFYMQKMNDI